MLGVAEDLATVIARMDNLMLSSPHIEASGESQARVDPEIGNVSDATAAKGLQIKKELEHQNYW